MNAPTTVTRDRLLEQAERLANSDGNPLLRFDLGDEYTGWVVKDASALLVRVAGRYKDSETDPLGLTNFGIDSARKIAFLAYCEGDPKANEALFLKVFGEGDEAKLPALRQAVGWHPSTQYQVHLETRKLNSENPLSGQWVWAIISSQKLNEPLEVKLPPPCPDSGKTYKVEKLVETFEEVQIRLINAYALVSIGDPKDGSRESFLFDILTQVQLCDGTFESLKSFVDG